MAAHSARFSEHTFIISNICFILMGEKVGVNLCLRFFHFLPDARNRCPDRGSIFSFEYKPRSWKFENFFVSTKRMSSVSQMTREGVITEYMPTTGCCLYCEYTSAINSPRTHKKKVSRKCQCYGFYVQNNRNDWLPIDFFILNTGSNWPNGVIHSG